jgi:hypothetical protein
MIDFKDIWLPQIISYAAFIADENTVRDVWISGDQTITSATSYDELYEQVFGDLDSKAIWKDHKKELSDKANLQLSIDDFLNNFLLVDAQFGKRNCTDHAALLMTPLWKQLRQTARKVIERADEEGLGQVRIEL